MLFAHPAPASAIGRIKRTGLKMGRGRQGRGVYAVPLLNISRTELRNVPRTDEDWAELPHDPPLVTSAPFTSLTLWRWLFQTGLRAVRGGRPVAVVFQLPTACLPVELFLEIENEEIAEGFLSELTLVTCRDFEPPYVWGSPTRTRVELAIHTTEALGHVMHLFLQAGATTARRWGENVEVVIRGPVPASAIRKLIPLSRTNRKAKAQSFAERQRGHAVEF